jgi:hypothetical protein
MLICCGFAHFNAALSLLSLKITCTCSQATCIHAVQPLPRHICFGRACCTAAVLFAALPTHLDMFAGNCIHATPCNCCQYRTLSAVPRASWLCFKLTCTCWQAYCRMHSWQKKCPHLPPEDDEEAICAGSVAASMLLAGWLSKQMAQSRCCSLA